MHHHHFFRALARLLGHFVAIMLIVGLLAIPASAHFFSHGHNNTVVVSGCNSFVGFGVPLYPVAVTTYYPPAPTPTLVLDPNLNASLYSTTYSYSAPAATYTTFTANAPVLVDDRRVEVFDRRRNVDVNVNGGADVTVKRGIFGNERIIVH